MKITVKKIVSMLLILVMITCSMDVQAWAEQVVEETVYVDGSPIKVIVDPEKGTIVAEALGQGEDSRLVISETEMNVATVYNEQQQNYVNYKLEINDLSENKVDIEVINEEGNIIDQIDDVNEITNNSYVGRAAVTVITTITVETLITAILEAAACIVVGSVIYYGARAAVTAIKKDKDKKKSYYKAYIYNKNVFIDMYNNISRKKAVKRIKKGKNVYVYSSKKAKQIVKDTGLGCTPSEISCLKGKVRFYHYHTANRNGAHSFYGNTVTY